MSTSTQTVAERFQGYANEAIERAMDRVTQDGLDAPLCEWLMASEPWQADWNDRLSIVAHDTLRGEDEAELRLTTWLRLVCPRYLAAWSDEMRIGFMAQIDAETAEAKRLDLAEGNDD